MDRDKLADLAAFAIIAEERSFRKAAARLGISGSALSHAMRVLEDRLGVKLLHRTTRNIAPTEAGERLLAGLKPALVDIDHALQGLDSYRGRPAGRVRISAHRSAAIHLIAPKLRGLRDAYPEVIVELSIDDGLIDIVSAGFDAGVRRGEQLEKDMISVRVGADSQMAVVASPDYFMNAPYPTSPSGLSQHSCIGYRYIASRELHRWRFEKAGRTLHVAVEPGFITNDAEMLVQAAMKGIGLAYVPLEQVGAQLASGDLVRVLAEWSSTIAGSFLYYPNRRQMAPSLRAVIDALRYTPP